MNLNELRLSWRLMSQDETRFVLDDAWNPDLLGYASISSAKIVQLNQSWYIRMLCGLVQSNHQCHMCHSPQSSSLGFRPGGILGCSRWGQQLTTITGSTWLAVLGAFQADSGSGVLPRKHPLCFCILSKKNKWKPKFLIGEAKVYLRKPWFLVSSFWKTWNPKNCAKARPCEPPRTPRLPASPWAMQRMELGSYGWSPWLILHWYGIITLWYVYYIAYERI